MTTSLKHLACGLIAATIAISPAMAKPGGGKGNGGGGKAPHKEKATPAKPDKSKDKGKPDKDKADKGKPDKPANPAEMRRAGIAPADAKRLAKQHQFGGYKPLPPGIRKNLLRGKPIPPGLAGTPIPPAYLATLPAYPGYEWRAYGTDLALVSVATSLIADVIMDILD